MKVNRETHQHVNTEDLREFVNSLKPMEAVTLIDVLVRDKYIIDHPALSKMRIQQRLVNAIANLQQNAQEIENLLSGKES